MQLDIRNFELTNVPEDYIDNPYRYLAALRSEQPVHQMADGSYLLTRHDDLTSVYRDPTAWSSDKKADFKPKFGDSPLYEHHTTSVVFTDPPDHTRIRKLFQAAFTRKALVALEPRIHELVDSYLDELADRGAMNVVDDFSFKLPIEVVLAMLGVPSDDRELIRGWAVAILTALEPSLSQQQSDDGNRSVTEFKSYLRDLVAYRRQRPTDGSSGEILTALMAAEEDGEKLSELELLHQCIFMLNAGHETSTNMISHGVHEMLRNPDQCVRLQGDPDLIEPCVEEILRYQPPIQINNRRSTVPVSFRETDLPVGTTVHLMIAGGNRDPEQFPNPDRFDIGRRPNRHLSFALGIHTCAGNNLARVEAVIAFQKLFDRFPKLQLKAPARLANRMRFREITELKVSVK